MLIILLLQIISINSHNKDTQLPYVYLGERSLE